MFEIFETTNHFKDVWNQVTGRTRATIETWRQLSEQLAPDALASGWRDIPSRYVTVSWSFWLIQLQIPSGPSQNNSCLEQKKTRFTQFCWAVRQKKIDMRT